MSGLSSVGVCSLQPRPIETLDNGAYLTYRLNGCSGPTHQVRGLEQPFVRTLGGHERFRTHARAAGPDGQPRR